MREYGELFLICFLLDRRNCPYSWEDSNKEHEKPWTQLVTPKQANKQDKTVKSDPRLLVSVTCNRDKT